MLNSQSQYCRNTTQSIQWSAVHGEPLTMTIQLDFNFCQRIMTIQRLFSFFFNPSDLRRDASNRNQVETNLLYCRFRLKWRKWQIIIIFNFVLFAFNSVYVVLSRKLIAKIGVGRCNCTNRWLRCRSLLPGWVREEAFCPTAVIVCMFNAKWLRIQRYCFVTNWWRDICADINLLMFRCFI